MTGRFDKGPCPDNHVSAGIPSMAYMDAGDGVMRSAKGRVLCADSLECLSFPDEMRDRVIAIWVLCRGAAVGA
jgi:hypothetical protein